MLVSTERKLYKNVDKDTSNETENPDTHLIRKNGIPSNLRATKLHVANVVKVLFFSSSFNYVK